MDTRLYFYYSQKILEKQPLFMYYKLHYSDIDRI
nr:MAG TPA: hypothetical protein [Caudoviricetes sp.]DAX10410.1 MAG TPA: hypothetical protein [Bacteriophage sp.]